MFFSKVMASSLTLISTLYLSTIVASSRYVHLGSVVAVIRKMQVQHRQYLDLQECILVKSILEKLKVDVQSLSYTLWFKLQLSNLCHLLALFTLNTSKKPVGFFQLYFKLFNKFSGNDSIAFAN